MAKLQFITLIGSADVALPHRTASLAACSIHWSSFLKQRFVQRPAENSWNSSSILLSSLAFKNYQPNTAIPNLGIMTSVRTTSSTCSHCHNPMKIRCTGCCEAPVYDEDTREDTFYCGSVCQQADWRQHKPTCKTLQHRKYLHRAASLLQQMMYWIQRHASPTQFKSACVDGSWIYINRCLSVELAAGLHLAPFSISLGGNRDLFDAVSVYMDCMEAMVYLYSLTKELLAS